MDVHHLIELARPYWPVIAGFIVWPLLTGILNWWLWWDSPSNWERFAKAHPKLAFVVRLNRAWGPHLRKVVVAWRDLAAARSTLPPAATEPVPPVKRG